jgi:hypothetical protein
MEVTRVAPVRFSLALGLAGNVPVVFVEPIADLALAGEAGLVRRLVRLPANDDGQARADAIRQDECRQKGQKLESAQDHPTDDTCRRA